MADAKLVEKLNEKIYDNGGVDREHLLEFLEGLTTNDSDTIIREVKKWLENLHNDPKYSKVQFPRDDIEQILGDLDSYGRLSPETILQFREEHPRTVNK